MIYAHLDVPGNVPWIDEFFGHPGEYWPVYLFISALVSVIILLFIEIHFLKRGHDNNYEAIQNLYDGVIRVTDGLIQIRQGNDNT